MTPDSGPIVWFSLLYKLILRLSQTVYKGGTYRKVLLKLFLRNKSVKRRVRFFYDQPSEVMWDNEFYSSIKTRIFARSTHQFLTAMTGSQYEKFLDLFGNHRVFSTKNSSIFCETIHGSKTRKLFQSPKLLQFINYFHYYEFVCNIEL